MEKIPEEIRLIIQKRLKAFERLGKDWCTCFDFNPFFQTHFCTDLVKEFVFCFCTANSSAISGLKVQKLLEKENPFFLSLEEWQNILKSSGVRFYQRKSGYIFKALKNFELVERALNFNTAEARKALLRFKGLGLKEASHFLRNTGRKDVAILDRHILRWLLKKGYISNIPSSLTPSTYLKIENLVKELAKRSGISPAGFDLVLWYHQTGKVLK